MAEAATQERPLGDKRHVGRTGPRVEPTTPLAKLIRYTRESANMSRPDLSRLTGITVASLHSLEHDREPRDGELELVLPVLRDAVDREVWEKYGGPEFLEDPKPQRRRTRKAA